MTIVNQYPIMAQRAPEWVILLFLGCLTICCYFFTLNLVTKNRIGIIIFGCCVAFSCLLLFLGSVRRPTGRNCYECLIDDTVSFTEIAENYDIVGQRGNLLILEDKDAH